MSEPFDERSDEIDGTADPAPTAEELPAIGAPDVADEVEAELQAAAASEPTDDIGEPLEDVEAVDEGLDPDDAQAEVEAVDVPAGDQAIAEALAAGEDDTETSAVDPAADAQAETAEAELADTTVVDPLEEFREALRSKPGEWYVVHTYSGMEKRVKSNIENRITSLNMEDFIYEVEVPQEDVWEIKNGQRKQVSRTVLPGYVLVRMDLTDESWGAVRHTPSVTGFVGQSHTPVPLSLAEVENMLAPSVEVPEQPAAPAQEGAAAAPQQTATKKAEFSDFAEGDSVMIIDGAFATLHATITEINLDAQRVKALVEIFGRETPVELGFTEIQKV